MSKREERSIICFIGRTNSGKSSLLNVLSGQKDFALVDPTPGTTADTVVTHMEIHGIGPCKVLDTAGIDEFSPLGEKKRRKTFDALEEADLSIVVIDLIRAGETGDVSLELELIKKVHRCGGQCLIVYNVFKNRIADERAMESCRLKVEKLMAECLPSLLVNASVPREQASLATFVKTFFRRDTREIDLLPALKDSGFVLLIIPMDEETPTLRLLRPQDMAVERILRKFAIPVLFRLNLKKARSNDQADVTEEKKRYEELLNLLQKSPEGLQLAITDSQAFDIVAPWTPPKIPLTSFSIMMTNYMSFGNLKFFIEGVKTVDSLKPGDKVMIAEACNHNRICDDLATVQIPRHLNRHTGGELKYTFNFGRTYPEDLAGFKLIIHCGGCMIDRQKYLRRTLKAREAGVAFTNYGILLSYLQGEKVLERTVRPFLKEDQG